MMLCSDATVDITETNPSGYGLCGGNELFRCLRPLAGSQPDSPGVCFQTSLVDKLGKERDHLDGSFLDEGLPSDSDGVFQR